MCVRRSLLTSTIALERFKVQIICRSASFGQQSLLIGFFFHRKIISIYSEHIQRQGTMHSPCEFIIIPRLSQAQWIWNANELVRIKKSLWSETSPNLLQDKRYIAMAYTPSLSLPESQYFYIYSPILGHLHPHTHAHAQSAAPFHEMEIVQAANVA